MPAKRRAPRVQQANVAADDSPKVKDTTVKIVDHNNKPTRQGFMTHCAALENSVSPYSGTCSGNPELWLTKFTRYAKLKQLDEQLQCLSFPLFLKDSALFWYEQLDDETKNNFSDLVSRFIEEFQLNSTLKMSKLAHLIATKQKDGESVSDYLLQISQQCRELGRTPDQEMEFAVQGLLPHIRQQVMLSGPSSIHDVRKVALLVESINPPTNTTTHATPAVNTMQDEMSMLKDKLTAQEKQISELTTSLQAKDSRKRRYNGDNQSNKRRRPCGRCDEHHRYGQCPAYGKECSKCKKTGHFPKVCKSVKPKTD